MKVRGAWAVPVLVILFVTACSSKQGPTARPSTPGVPGATQGTEAPSVSSEEVPAAVTIRVRGAQAFDWNGVQTLTVGRAGSKGAGVNLLSIGTKDFAPLSDPMMRFRWAVDLLNAYDDKPGTFRLAPNDKAAGTQSLAFVIVVRVKDQSEPLDDMADVEWLEHYGEIREPCVLKIRDRGGEGRLDCPALVSNSGESIQATISWRRNHAAAAPGVSEE